MNTLYRLMILLLLGLATIPKVAGQTVAFSGGWSFEGTDAGVSSNSLIALSDVSYTGVNKLAVNPYTAGYTSLGVNVQNWSASSCNNTEYVQFGVQPVGTAKLTLTTLTFAFARSPTGPQNLTVRSSVDGFSAAIYTAAVAEYYQVATLTFNSPEFTSQTTPITFRIYACNPSAGGGTLKLDEILFNGSSLPVTLISFIAKPEGDRVQLAWATSVEHDADRFVIERSADLGEYLSLGEVAAKGTTTTRQHYGFTDYHPLPGENYYRLRQIDHDGTSHTFRPVSVVVQTDALVAVVYPNPADPARIHLRLWNASDASVRLLTLTGQFIPCRLDRRLSEADLIPQHPLSTGIYWLEIQADGRKRVSRVLIR
ncbi:T9SS type A sorting domain-containing protein [Spirosoma utsteinense]|uniref:Secretion system C-terminal sorting domain-containing protein n=1 Tax=Spirosoma utsteinense TaxID=2585773 RepID=A0ABR6W2W1_9BACT|nr:T9SS type A sorting domain-containing protein [Spirosoma utsteinense]MBC3784276.1 hypothetical protein [Spirosoma utsteinense]MBC3790927.1 hypothetical protein [Spirosoma utsteinense]